jgi:hypothetical protein
MPVLPVTRRYEKFAQSSPRRVRPVANCEKFHLLEAGAIVLKDVKPWMIVIENTARD